MCDPDVSGSFSTSRMQTPVVDVETSRPKIKFDTLNYVTQRQTVNPVIGCLVPLVLFL